MKKTFEAKTFNLPQLAGISQKNIEEHLKLYAGYVKHANLIQEKIEEYKKDVEKNAYVLGELQRRFGFEFCGMRNHEYYFSQFEGGKKEVQKESLLYKKIEEVWGSYENWESEFVGIALTRGVGWAILYYDRETNTLLNTWVDEQHLGHLVTCEVLLALDMWEHAYVYDYPTSEKKKYVGAFFENLNWTTVESRFEK